MRQLTYIVIALLLLAPIGAGLVGRAIGPGLLHPMRLNPERLRQTAEMLKRSGAVKGDFNVRAPDGVELRGWKIRPPSPNGDWMLLFHGVSDNRTGVLGHAEFLLRHGYSVVMMDSRAHGESGGDMATYGWKERHDTVAIVNALYSTEKVNHLYALGVSMGAAVALQSAIAEPRIEGVVAEDPFAIYRAASGPKELWVVNGAQHASALGHAPAEYEKKVVRFLQGNDRRSPSSSHLFEVCTGSQSR